MADLLNRPGLNTQAPQAQDNTNKYFEPDNYNRIFNQVSSAVDKAKSDKEILESLIGSKRDPGSLTPEEVELLKNTAFYKQCADKRDLHGIDYLLQMPYNQFITAEKQAEQYLKDAPKRQAQRESDARKAQEERDKQEAEQRELARQSAYDISEKEHDAKWNQDYRKKNNLDKQTKEYETTQNILNGMREGPDNRF